MSLTMERQDVPHELREGGHFTQRQYNRAKAFSSFLPGIAGLWGIPLWLYFVNRGQAVCSFGVRDKDHAIMEFQPATRSYRRVSLEGFRTFFKFQRNGERILYEPFRMGVAPEVATNSLTITPSALGLHEDHHGHQLSVDVEYLTVPNEPFAALGRKVTITNHGHREVAGHALDGFPMVVARGESAQVLQQQSFLIEAWLDIKGLEQKIPRISLSAMPSDTAETEFISSANFFLGVRQVDGRWERLNPIVDPWLVFGDYQDFVRPYAFDSCDGFDVPSVQDSVCQRACAFVHTPVTIQPKSQFTFYSYFGCLPDVSQAGKAGDRLAQEGFFESKQDELETEISSVRDRAFVHTSHTTFNEYVPQTFLDNTLRGGLPITLPSGERRHVFHVYSRKHGDLERDYNFFSLSDTYFSQGNGNFRDVNQNRRMDVWINPDVGSSNIELFFSLLQPDGFNPLVIEGAKFVVRDPGKARQRLHEILSEQAVEKLQPILASPFAPGEFFIEAEKAGVDVRKKGEALLRAILPSCDKIVDCVYGEGFWSDHWYYSFDLINEFLAIFPERLREILVDSTTYTYRDDAVEVLPRDLRYVRLPDGRLRHIGSLGLDVEKQKLIASRESEPHCVRAKHGKGDVYHSNLLGKVLCLLASKAAILSPSGIGIELEGGRPGWLDSMNGTPSLFGASTSEVFHLLAAIRSIRSLLHRLNLPQSFEQALPREVHAFLRELSAAFADYLQSQHSDKDFACWDRANNAKEQFRRETRFGFKGTEKPLSLKEILHFLDVTEARILESLPKAVDPETGFYATYVTHEVTDYELLDQKSPRGLPCIRPKAFEHRLVVPSLEAPTHALRFSTSREEAGRIRSAVRESVLYDPELKMYRLHASLRKQSTELGRSSVWPPGWLENENIFMHMEHKFLLAEFQAGLYEEFFEDFRNVLVPFQDPAVYGHSPIENVSFIVSSLHPRRRFVGQGHQARSSGTTAEILNLMLWMSFGKQPFLCEDGRLRLCFDPVLPDWFFTEQPATRVITRPSGEREEVRLPAGSYSILFLANTLVTFLNPDRRPTYGEGAARPSEYEIQYQSGEVLRTGPEGPVGAKAEAVRDLMASRMVVHLA